VGEKREECLRMCEEGRGDFEVDARQICGVFGVFWVF